MLKTPLFEMARIGFIGDLEIYIRTDDPGHIPHFHIWDKETKGDKFHSCVRIDKAAYFFHEGKRDILNSRQRKELVRFLESPYKRYNITNWQYLVGEWNNNNSTIEIPDDYPMPNYLMLRS